MPIKLLVADDHEVIRQGVASMLSGTDIKVVAEADTADKAIQLTKKHKPDVVLLDVRMPELDGFDAAVLIREHERVNRLKATPIVGVSNASHIGLRRKCLSSGMDDVVAKPDSAETLTRLVEAPPIDRESEGADMAEETLNLLEQIVQELRGLRRELAAIHEELAPFVEERRAVNRMQSPLMGVDHFHVASEERRD